ncbi:MAG: FRG domain-containing protein [Chloroflexi bacterium]|nr:FRG domain-containing protein [Chloroflexota bacterium]
MSTWNNFLLQLKQAQAELKCSYSGAWYRGVSCSTYALVPKLFRRPLKPEAEANIYKAYLRTRMANPQAGSWTHVVDMQHYGTATRLLDWTE